MKPSTKGKQHPAFGILLSLLLALQTFAQSNSEEFTFHTTRPPGSTFTFTITADSHLDEHTDAATYQRTLANALADAPDFHIDLGDTFMTEKHLSREAAAKQYVAQRYYFGQLCDSVPRFLVLGNHDGESPRGRGSDSDNLAVWSNLMRKRYFPNPIPDAFYTGDVVKHPAAGLLQDYYAWTWDEESRNRRSLSFFSRLRSLLCAGAR
jgi:hypothetical protein